MKKLLNTYNLIENTQLADKTYFKKGLMSQEVRNIIINSITNGDPYTKLVSDFVYAKLQHDEYVSDYLDTSKSNLSIKGWQEIKEVYEELKTYNKNVFPIKGYNINGVENPNHFMGSLQIRKDIKEKMKKIPSVGIRNLKNDIRVERDQTELRDYRHKLDYVITHLSLLNNRDEETKNIILRKIFKKGSSIEEISNFIDDKETLIGGKEFSKDDIMRMMSEEGEDMEVVFKSKDVLVLEVYSEEAIKRIGCNSLWCFTYENRNSWNSNWSTYSYNGMVYVLIDFKEDYDSPEFMHVLIKPIDFTSKPNEYGEDEPNEDKLYDMSNNATYYPLDVLDGLMGLNKARLTLTFGDEPQKLPRKPKEKVKDPNQLEFSFESKLSTLYKNLINEDLEYAHSDTEGVEDDVYTIGCDSSVTPFRTELSENATNTITVYHGRRSKYNSVNELFNKVNENDGALLYGWGLYATDNIDVAKEYSKNYFSNEGNKYINLAMDLTGSDNVRDIISFFKEQGQWDMLPNTVKKILTSNMNASASSLIESGYLYELEINTTKPPYKWDSNEYNNLVKKLGSKKKASLFLNEKGYFGVIVPNSGLSGDYKEGNNYTIFHPSEVKIKNITKL